jgi:putative chitinase
MTQAALSLTQFAQMFPKTVEYFPYFLAPGAACEEFEINTPERLAAFFAQLSHESAGLTRLEESFAYTPARLETIWPARFDFDTSVATARYFRPDGTAKQEAIANTAYAMRLGNGPEKSGDGFRYRGRGPIQLTGRKNYAEFGEGLHLPLETSPDLAALIANGARIAGRFWITRGCNALADALDVRGVTRAINGGLTGFKERKSTWLYFRTLLGLNQVAA